MQTYEVIIIGGSYAGLSAAMALGRSLRKVLIIDAGAPCNAPTPHSHNFLTQDGSTPEEIAAIARDQVLKYPTVGLQEAFAIAVTKTNDSFVVKTQDGEAFQSTALLLSTGVKDTFAPIPGLRECWGKTVLHCPYCHGYEVRGKKLAVIANGDTTMDYTRMILNLSQDVILLTNGTPEMPEEATAFFRSAGMTVIPDPIEEMVHASGRLQKITFKDRESLDLDAAFTRLAFTHHSDIAKNLGCAFTETNHIEVDHHIGKTSVEGVYAAGDCTTPQRSVSIAIASGTKAGTGINKYLLDRQKFSVIDPVPR